MTTASTYTDKTAKEDTPGRSIGAAVTGAMLGGGIPGGAAAYFGKKDKDKGKQNIGKWGAGAAAAGAAGGAYGLKRLERNVGRVSGKLKAGALGASALFAGGTTAGHYGLGRLWSKGKKKKSENKTKRIEKTAEMNRNDKDNMGAMMSGGLVGLQGKKDKDEGKQNIKNYLAGGAVLGGSAGAYGVKKWGDMVGKLKGRQKVLGVGLGALVGAGSIGGSYGTGRAWSHGKKKKKA